MIRIDARALLAAWKAVREAGIDPFSSSAPERLPAAPGWSSLRLPSRNVAEDRLVTVLDALRALALRDREIGKAADKVQLVGTLPMRAPGVVPTREAIRELIVSTKIEVLVIGFAFTDGWLRDLLVERAHAGVAVTVVGDRKNRVARALHRDWPAGLPLAAFEDVDGMDEYRSLHAKVIVADRERAVIGSANFTLGGLERNLELGVRVEGETAERIVRTIEGLVREGWLVGVLQAGR